MGLFLFLKAATRKFNFLVNPGCPCGKKVLWAPPRHVSGCQSGWHQTTELLLGSSVHPKHVLIWWIIRPDESLFTPSTDFVSYEGIHTTAEHLCWRKLEKRYMQRSPHQQTSAYGNKRLTIENLCFRWCLGQNERKSHHQFGLITSNNVWQTAQRLPQLPRKIYVLR